ncbi:hypothetical protein MPSEU_000307500 [Mayamaea pseudoterrestris]|nr:hypothetical protein MPSEU_000307500 [Mayamaea pseudoterrestris]
MMAVAHRRAGQPSRPSNPFQSGGTKLSYADPRYRSHQQSQTSCVRPMTVIALMILCGCLYFLGASPVSPSSLMASSSNNNVVNAKTAIISSKPGSLLQQQQQQQTPPIPNEREEQANEYDAAVKQRREEQDQQRMPENASHDRNGSESTLERSAGFEQADFAKGSEVARSNANGSEAAGSIENNVDSEQDEQNAKESDEGTDGEQDSLVASTEEEQLEEARRRAPPNVNDDLGNESTDNEDSQEDASGEEGDEGNAAGEEIDNASDEEGEEDGNASDHADNEPDASGEENENASDQNNDNASGEENDNATDEEHDKASGDNEQNASNEQGENASGDNENNTSGEEVGDQDGSQEKVDAAMVNEKDQVQQPLDESETQLADKVQVTEGVAAIDAANSNETEATGSNVVNDAPPSVEAQELAAADPSKESDAIVGSELNEATLEGQSNNETQAGEASSVALTVDESSTKDVNVTLPADDTKALGNTADKSTLLNDGDGANSLKDEVVATGSKANVVIPTANDNEAGETATKDQPDGDAQPLNVEASTTNATADTKTDKEDDPNASNAEGAESEVAIAEETTADALVTKPEHENKFEAVDPLVEQQQGEAKPVDVGVDKVIPPNSDTTIAEKSSKPEAGPEQPDAMNEQDKNGSQSQKVDQSKDNELVKVSLRGAKQAKGDGGSTMTSDKQILKVDATEGTAVKPAGTSKDKSEDKVEQTVDAKSETKTDKKSKDNHDKNSKDDMSKVKEDEKDIIVSSDKVKKDEEASIDKDSVVAASIDEAKPIKDAKKEKNVSSKTDKAESSIVNVSKSVVAEEGQATVDDPKKDDKLLANDKDVVAFESDAKGKLLKGSKDAKVKAIKRKVKEGEGGTDKAKHRRKLR